MHETQKRKNRIRSEAQTLAAVLAAFVFITVVGVFAFLRFYNSYIDGILYRERLNQMQEVTTQLFSGLDDVVSNQWNDVDTFCNYVELGKPQDSPTLQHFMQKQAMLNNMDSFGRALIAVDDLGRYMTQDGWQGMLEEMNQLFDRPDRLNFVSKSLTSEETRMYFLKLLPEPIELQDGNRTVKLLYYGISQNMTQLNPYFSCAAYNNSNSVYVLNLQGMKMFRSSNSSTNLVGGYNAYSVLERMDYLHGHSFNDARSDLDKTGHGYANAILDGEEYYYALYRMEHADWVLLFLVPAAHVASNVVSMVNTTVRLILIFSLILLTLSAVAIFAVLRFQQNRALQAERRNSAELESLNAKLESASKAKSDFLANMSHDIRTPMNAIVGITRLMAHDKRDPEKMDAYIQKVQLSSQHLLSLINDVLDMSKIESSDVTLNREPVSLAEQVGQVESIVRPQTDDREQTLSVRVHGISHEYLLGDAVRLRQIFINLLSNAVKYTPNGGHIAFDLEELASSDPEKARYRISVTDDGYGMTPEFVSHIFEPFTRAENSTTNRVQGTGLGMSITKNIVDLMGGTIGVQSEPGKGSCFTIELPLDIDHSASPELSAKNILLITDDEEFIRNARASLKCTGASLRVARSEAVADAVLSVVFFDLVLLGGSLQGDALADNVRRLREKTGQAVLIYCCGYDEQEQVHKMVKNGDVDGLLIHPFFLSNLIRVIDRVHNDVPLETTDTGSVLSGMHFLCAEDNSLNAEILTAVLDMNGASCKICRNGREIVDAFASVKPGDYDAILMDVQMPIMNGLDATREIRKSENPLGKTIPIIAMTANAFSDDVQNCLDAGMDAHVSKPLDIAALERAVRKVACVGGDSCPS